MKHKLLLVLLVLTCFCMSGCNAAGGSKNSETQSESTQNTNQDSELEKNSELILDNNVHYGDEDGVSDDNFDEVINEEENFDDVSTEDMLEEYPETSEEYSEENYE